MKRWLMGNSRLEVGVIEQGGMLDPVRFFTQAGVIEPLHRAPWLGEQDISDLPLLQNLRGDFFCAPFGASDLLKDETRPHGAPANDSWQLVSQAQDRLVLELATRVSGARLLKTLEIKADQPILYQRHDFFGGEGRLPLGHHAMLGAQERLELSFSPWCWGATPPEPVETPASQGRSLLKYPQTFSDLARVAKTDGSFVDLRSYPSLERSEEILMLAADSGLPFAWSAAVARQAGWLWFALKNPRQLQSTVLWLSSGGRDYAPWSGRHHCIGIEEVSAYFHLGHRASVAKTELSAKGIQTALDLQAGKTLSISYLFGVQSIPQGFDRVASIEAVSGGVLIGSEAGPRLEVPCDLAALQGGG